MGDHHQRRHFRAQERVVFSLPGAFTPTCSSTHLPRFNELAPTFKAQGIDSIVCIAVNDPFVMEEWGRDQELKTCSCCRTATENLPSRWVCWSTSPI
jgi:peroxiredoxin